MTVYERTLDRIIRDARRDADALTGAACAGLGAVMDNPDKEAEALALCKGCPVRLSCYRWVMAYSDADDPGGVCGGMTEQGRKDLRWQNSPSRAAQVEAGRARMEARKNRAEETYRKFVVLRRRMSYSSAASKLGISITLAGRLEDRRLADAEAADADAGEVAS